MLIGLIPVFNEEETVIGVLQELEKQVDFIVIINDGSCDNTDSLIGSWVKKKEKAYYISLNNNNGMAYAIKQGFSFILKQYKSGIYTKNDCVVLVDADGQHDPKNIAAMYRYFFDNKLDLLVARRNFSLYPLHRVIGNNLSSAFVSYLAKFRFYDVHCGFKILKITLVADLLDFYTAFRYSCSGQIGVIAGRLGYNIDNSYLIDGPYYRKGNPNIFDFFTGLFLDLVVASKIKVINRKLSVIE
ncbi:MAG: glycosyltransferase family 2 protein [Candidatus Omnitrophota bacterium]|nr:glycosyltransferase family 2 protein [Candidatus Omnitrophota bacterium]